MVGRRAVLSIAFAGLLGCGRIGFDELDDAMTVREQPSCISLAATCGATGKSSCCDSPMVPGGTFFRSHDVAGDALFPDMSAPATLSSFRLDAYEVTVGRFRRFLEAGQGTQAAPPLPGSGARTIAGVPDQGGWDASWNASLPADTAALRAIIKCDASKGTWTDAPAANEERPMNCVDWYESVAFCAWDDGYLASEAQWNFAAAGGTEQRAYPWSQPPSAIFIDPTRASYNVDVSTTGCRGDGIVGCTIDDLVRVGSKPAGDALWGHSDLAGNVYEWVFDAFVSPYASPCDDCADLTPGVRKLQRGGAFDFDEVQLRSALRSGFGSPGNRNDSTGLRCARDL